MNNEVEREVKILNLDVDTSIERIKKCNGVLKEDCVQKIFTYDLSSIVDRYEELIRIFAERNFDELLIRFKTLFREVDSLLTCEQINDLEAIYEKGSLLKLLEGVDNVNSLYNLVTSNYIKDLICNYVINPNKWIRLRETNGKVTLTIKHISGLTNDGLQNVKETENKDFIVLQGAIDCAFLENDKYVLVDYKTDRISDISELFYKYNKQVELYKYALRTSENIDVKETILYSFSLGDSYSF